jgi:hypothetical protein
MLKRTSCFVVVKGIDKTQTLIEELLRLGVMRGNGMVRIPDAGNQRDRPALRMHGVVLSGGHAQAKKCSIEKVRQRFHLVILLILIFVYVVGRQKEATGRSAPAQAGTSYSNLGPLAMEYVRSNKNASGTIHLRSSFRTCAR